MREDYGYFGVLSLVYGIIFAFCLYKNTHGITMVLFAIMTIVFAMLYIKKIGFVLQKKSKRYFIGMILLSVATALTTTSFFITFNFIGIVLLFGVAMIHQFYDDGKWNFPAYLERVFILFGSAILRIGMPYKHGAQYLIGEKQGKKRTFTAIILGLLVAIALISIILPLLLSSDMMFAKVFGEIFKYINFRNIVGIIIYILIGFTAFYATCAAIGTYNFPSDNGRKAKYRNPVVGITFTFILGVIYAMYCAIQILYLFLGIEKGLPNGAFYSEYARSGFWELLFVAIINFILVLVCMYVFSKSNILKGILTFISLCTYIMMLSAAYRMSIYVSQYHLTFLRVLVLWFLLVLSLIMTGVIINIYKQTFPLFRYIVMIVSICYTVFALSRPGYWIAEYNVAQTKNMKVEDLTYLMRNFPEDAASAISKINPEEIDSSAVSYYDDNEEKEVSRVKGSLYDYFTDISQNNEDVYFRKANYARIRAKQVADEYLEKHSDYKEHSNKRR